MGGSSINLGYNIVINTGDNVENKKRKYAEYLIKQYYKTIYPYAMGIDLDATSNIDESNPAGL